MTLPASGTITWNQICVEFSLDPATAVWPASFYGKGGAPASGALSFSNFYGRSAATSFTPSPGTYSFNDNGIPGVGTGASGSVTSNSGSVTWTWTTSGINAGLVTSNIASGGAGATITFSLPANHVASTNRVAQVHLTQGANTWTINLSASGDGGGTGGLS